MKRTGINKQIREAFNAEDWEQYFGLLRLAKHPPDPEAFALCLTLSVTEWATVVGALTLADAQPCQGLAEQIAEQVRTAFPNWKETVRKGKQQ